MSEQGSWYPDSEDIADAIRVAYHEHRAEGKEPYEYGGNPQNPYSGRSMDIERLVELCGVELEEVFFRHRDVFLNLGVPLGEHGGDEALRNKAYDVVAVYMRQLY